MGNDLSKYKGGEPLPGSVMDDLHELGYPQADIDRMSYKDAISILDLRGPGEITADYRILGDESKRFSSPPFPKEVDLVAHFKINLSKLNSFFPFY